MIDGFKFLMDIITHVINYVFYIPIQKLSKHKIDNTYIRIVYSIYIYTTLYASNLTHLIINLVFIIVQTQ
jgi:hypothetical protein